MLTCGPPCSPPRLQVSSFMPHIGLNPGRCEKGSLSPPSNRYPHLWSTGLRTSRHVPCLAVLISKGIRLQYSQDVPIQPEGLPSDRSKITAGLPCVNLKAKMLAGQMAGATSSPVKTMMPSPLRFQVVRASEPTLRPELPSGSPPLLFSSAHRPRWQFSNRRRCPEIFLRCDWVGRD